MMRVAYVSADPGVPVFGRKGCSVHVQEIIRALRDQDARIELFATALGGSPPADLESVPVHRLVAIPKGAAAVRERAAMAANRELGATLSNPSTNGTRCGVLRAWSPRARWTRRACWRSTRP